MIVIKKMETAEEIKGKAYVHFQSWHEAYEGLISREYLDSFTLEKCETIAYRWPDGILIAKEDERVIGFIGLGVSKDGDLPDTGEIFALYILKEYYGLGIGQMLLEEGMKRLAHGQIALWVLKDNARAIRFYEKNGFSADGCEKSIRLGTPVTEMRMLLKK